MPPSKVHPWNWVNYKYISLTHNNTRTTITSANKPLGGECGKSWDNTNFMRKTPFSYGVPAARSRMLIKFEALTLAQNSKLSKIKLHAWAFNVCKYGRKIIIINTYFDSLRGGFIKILQFLCKLLYNIWWKIFISCLKIWHNQNVCQRNSTMQKWRKVYDMFPASQAQRIFPKRKKENGWMIKANW